MNGKNKVEDCVYHNYNYVARTSTGYIMDAKCEYCGNEIKDCNPKTFENFIRRWFHGKLENNTLYSISKMRNYCANNEELYYLGKGRNTAYGKDVLAIKLPDGRIIGNASKLLRCGSYRRGVESPAQRVMQQLEMPLIPFNIFQETGTDLKSIKIISQGKSEELTLPKLIWSDSREMLVPINLWEEKRSKTKPVKSDKITDIEFHDWDKGYYSYMEFNEKNLEKRHFIGAMIFEVNKKYYLFDCDRKELEHYRFNAFVSELNKKCNTIEEAYDCLKPDEVKKAEKKGLKVLRQGEWFFIPTNLPKTKVAKKKDLDIVEKKGHPSTENYDISIYVSRERFITDELIKEKKKDEKLKSKYFEMFKSRVNDFNNDLTIYIEARKRLALCNPNKYSRRGELRAGRNRPNNVEFMLELPKLNLCKGEITHTGREHEPIILKDWYKPVPNTAINSFTIHGAVD